MSIKTIKDLPEEYIISNKGKIYDDKTRNMSVAYALKSVMEQWQKEFKKSKVKLSAGYIYLNRKGYK